MKTISLLTRKGGSGKSTLTTHWAVEAERTKGRRAVIFDFDPQGSCSSWYSKRQANSPLLIQSGPEAVQDHLEACKSEDVDFVLIDTVPDINAIAVHAARVSDLVVIPVRPSVLDIEAISASVELVEGVGAAAVIILNQSPAGSTIADEATQVLGQYGLTICPIYIVSRIAFSRSMIDGRTAREIEPSGKAAREIRDSWKWIKQQLGV
ncbi:AAA family ATPase [Almyronema epifaneia]|uniref:AAA family ATPase n=1 Tax=Almyronema epifaneia S1 TaxID=2991925 RepID=A0ABW6IJL0_9CYAN